MLETLPPSRTLTADEVVVILARGSARLSAGSSVAEWDDELDMLSYPALTTAEAGRHLIKAWFKIELSSAEARTAFRSLDKRTLGELAETIASKGPRVPAIAPVVIAGEPSLEVGVLRALRAALRLEGYRGPLRPSTGTARLLRRGAALYGALEMIAPGRFHVRDAAPRRTLVLQWAWTLSLVTLVAGAFTGNPFLLFGGIVAIVGALISRSVALRPQLLADGARIVTVADLCRAVASSSNESR